MEKKKQLFCIPYAGSSAMLYMKWKSYLRDDIELIPLELTGRGRRASESFYKSFEEAVEDLYEEIEKYELKDYGIFGHSMGSWLAIELAYKIEENKKAAPNNMFLSGNWPPHMQRDEPQLHKMTDEEFKTEILKVGGTPKELFEQKEIVQFFLPILRADYRILERYNGPKGVKKINSKFTILNGTDDDVKKEELDGWLNYTGLDFRICDFDGNHFFINEKIEEVVDLINKSM